MYQDMYAKMLIALRQEAAAVDKIINAVLELRALRPTRGRPPVAIVKKRKTTKKVVPIKKAKKKAA